MIWRFHGVSPYLRIQGDRLGLSRVLTDRARVNQEIHRVSILVAQLCDQYHKTPGATDGTPRLRPIDIPAIRGTLGQCEMELEKLHALAAAAAVIIDEAHRAYGLEPPARHFRVVCDFDEPEPEPGPQPPNGQPATATESAEVPS